MEPRESKVRELLVPLYSEERRLGRLHTALHTDARTVVSALAREVSGRGKPIKLAPERLARVDAALREDGAFEGIPALRDAIRTWREDSRLKGDAQSINAYYDAQRTKAYTEKLVRPQAVLATRCLELSGLDSSDSPLVLDLGCGSGLSIEPLQRKGCTVIGGICFTPPTHFSHMSHPTFPISHLLFFFYEWTSLWKCYEPRIRAGWR